VNNHDTAFAATMGRYQQELVRWNRQINLISRRDTLRRAAVLIKQCRDTWHELAETELAEWSTSEPILYFDLGSGGGLPGFVWHQLLVGQFPATRSVLVEPREKRAWFLERLNQLDPKHPHTVANQRWGEAAGVAIPSSTKVLISMKALKLSDPVVLAGLADATGGEGLVSTGRVTIARFYPTDLRWNQELKESLSLLDEPGIFGDYIYTPKRHHVVPPQSPGSEAASLVVSSYGFVARSR